MWREAVLAALVLVPDPDRREESHVGASVLFGVLYGVLYGVYCVLCKCMI